MTWMSRFFWLTPVIVLSFGAQRAHAVTSLGFDVVGGKGTEGSDYNGSYDIHVPDQEKPWEASVGYTYFHSTFNTPTKTSTVNLGLEHALDEQNDFRGSLTFSNDTINEIKYSGPSIGYTKTWFKSNETPEPTTGKPNGSYRMIDNDDTSDRAPGSANSDDLSKELASLSFDCDILVYSFDVTSSSVTVTSRRGRSTILPPRTSSDHETQVHPNLGFEWPFFDGTLTPSLNYGHYFYSSDPEAIEQAAGNPRFAGAAGQLNSVAGGFLENNADITFSFNAPLQIDFDPKIGADQSVLDNSWATIQEITLSRYFFDHVKVKLDWTRTIQYGDPEDLYSGGLTYEF